jgi:uncharacterized membrane protein YbhN (UPF0104 family)
MPDAPSPPWSDASAPTPRGIRRAERTVILSALASVAVFGAAAVWSGGRAVFDHVTGLQPALIAALLGLSLLNYAARMLRWHMFSRQAGLEVPWLAGAMYYVAGFSMTVTPGKLGEALRLWLLRRGHGYRYEHTAALLLADRLNDAGAMVLLAMAALSAFGGQTWAVVLAGVAITAFTFLFLRPALLLGVVEWAYLRLGRWPRLFARLRIALRQLGQLASWRVYGGALAIATLGWLAEAEAFHQLLLALGAKVSLGQAVFIFTFSMVVGAMAMLPGGLGGTEASMAGLLTFIGVDLDVAIAATAVIRTTTLWFAVLLGFAALPMALRSVGGAAGGGGGAGPGKAGSSPGSGKG